MLINSTNLKAARLMDFYQVMKIVATFLRKADLATLQLNNYANAFYAMFDDFDKAIKQALKTGFTDELLEADRARDSALTGFLNVLRGTLLFPDEGVIAAARVLMDIVEKYGSGIQRLPQREETAAIHKIVAEMTNAENSYNLSKTGLAEWVNRLNSTNRTFETLYISRTEKEAEFIAGLTREERAKMQAAFEKICEAINALSFVNGEAAYKTLAESINQEVENVQIAAKQRSTRSANERKKEESSSSSPEGQ